MRKARLFCVILIPTTGAPDTKALTFFGVYGCYWCHLELDASNVEYQDQMRALQETQMKLVEKGLIKIV
jgi:hypothetical protein